MITPASHHHGFSFRTIVLLVASLACACIHSHALAQAAGDECSNARVAVVGDNGPVNTSTLTPSANPPANNECTFLNWLPTTKDAWWVFNAPGAGRLTLSFCSSDYDTSVVLYQGSCGSLTRIACNDDGCVGGTIFQSEVSVQLTTGGAVYIRVGGYGTSVGNARFTLGYTPDGGAVAWGLTSSVLNLPPAALGSVTAISAGELHTVALRSDRTVQCWGDNPSGQLNVPAGLVNVVAIAAGEDHSVAVRADGTVVCWGANAVGQCTVPAGIGTISRVAAGRSHTIALRTVGTVVCWGSNGYGQCTVPPTLSAVSSVAAGSRHSLALKSDGTVVCWGDNALGQCNVPAGIGTISSIGTRYDTNIARRSNGTVVCWGNNDFGQCDVPAGLSSVTAVAAGDIHCLALKADGTVVGWGYSSGATIPPAGLRNVTAITAGNLHSVAITTRDCDANGVIDAIEYASKDCNNNGQHDCWDNEIGILEDCNNNGLGDSCEKQVTVSLATGQIGPIGFGSPKTWSIPNATSAVSNVTLVVNAKGDFGSTMEYVRLVCGNLFDREALNAPFTADCVISNPETFTLTPAQFNSGIGDDGTWRLDMLPSSAVDALLCPGGTWISATLAYTGANSADCDANGELDSCQIAAGTVPDTNGNGIPDTCESLVDSCPTDTDNNGETSASDLAGLLAAWGGKDPIYDFDNDGLIAASDLAAMLAAWGPCLAK